MKTTGLAALVLALAALNVQAAEPAITPTEITCEDLRERFELTPEGRERLQDLIGSCEGVVEINGTLYALTKATVRSASGQKVRLYLPATDKTVEITPRPEARVLIDGRKVRPRDLNRGDEITIHIAVERFAQERQLESVAMVTEAPAGAQETVMEAPVQEVEALPTTASSLPAMVLGGVSLLGLALFLRRFRTT